MYCYIMSEENQVNIRVPADTDGNTTSHETSNRNQKNGQEVAKHKKEAKKSKWPKTDSRHWQGRLFKNTFTRDGERQEAAADVRGHQQVLLCVPLNLEGKLKARRHWHSSGSARHHLCASCFYLFECFCIRRHNQVF